MVVIFLLIYLWYWVQVICFAVGFAASIGKAPAINNAHCRPHQLHETRQHKLYSFSITNGGQLV